MSTLLLVMMRPGPGPVGSTMIIQPHIFFNLSAFTLLLSFEHLLNPLSYERILYQILVMLRFFLFNLKQWVFMYFAHHRRHLASIAR